LFRHVAWSATLDWLRLPAAQRVLRSKTLPVYQDEKMLEANMAKEFITEAELMSQVRL
jgi:hypothetical protein